MRGRRWGRPSLGRGPDPLPSRLHLPRPETGHFTRGVCQEVWILLLLYRSSVPVRRNIVVHSMVLSFYSLAGAITLLLYQRVGDWATPAVNVALLVITDLSRVAWIVFLNRESERKPSG